MTYSQTNAEQRGGARKVFIARILQAVDEYLDGALKMTGLVSEVLDAARDYRRRQPSNQGRGR